MRPQQPTAQQPESGSSRTETGSASERPTTARGSGSSLARLVPNPAGTTGTGHTSDTRHGGRGLTSRKHMTIARAQTATSETLFHRPCRCGRHLLERPRRPAAHLGGDNCFPNICVCRPDCSTGTRGKSMAWLAVTPVVAMLERCPRAFRRLYGWAHRRTPPDTEFALSQNGYGTIRNF